MWRPCATARRDDRVAVGWAWTGRNLILDEALFWYLCSLLPHMLILTIFVYPGLVWHTCLFWMCVPSQCSFQMVQLDQWFNWKCTKLVISGNFCTIADAWNGLLRCECYWMETEDHEQDRHLLPWRQVELRLAQVGIGTRMGTKWTKVTATSQAWRHSTRVTWNQYCSGIHTSTMRNICT